MAKILLTGGTGLIGTALRIRLQQSGYSILNLSRSSSGPPDQISWPKSGYIDAGHLQGIQGIIHLAGAGVAEKRWTPARKKEIIDSRTELALLLLHSFKAAGVKPAFFISASGTGYYGSAGPQLLSEEDRSGNDFLAEVCRQWEGAAMAFSEITDRIVILRTGLVLAAEGGVLAKLLPTAKYGIGTIFGSGEQYWPWIHLEDICGIYMHAIAQKEVNGIYNAVAAAVSQKDFASFLQKTLKSPNIPAPVPAFLLKMLLGEMADSLLASQNAGNSKIIHSGYRFRFSELSAALEDLVR